MDGHGESATEFGLTDEEEGETVLGIHHEVGEDAQVFEDVGAEMMGLVDDEDGIGSGLDAEA